MFTGDDYNYVSPMADDEGGAHSDALLRAFAAVPRYAAVALQRLEAGDVAGFRSVLEPTLPLSRLIFAAPTQYYKVRVVWLWSSSMRAMCQLGCESPTIWMQLL